MNTHIAYFLAMLIVSPVLMIAFAEVLLPLARWAFGRGWVAVQAGEDQLVTFFRAESDVSKLPIRISSVMVLD